MKKGKTKGKISIILLASLAILAAASILIWRLFFAVGAGPVVPGAGDSNKYDVSDEIEEALLRLEKNPEKARVIKRVNASDKVVALTFQGLSNGRTNREILQQLTDFGMKSTFFLPATTALEDTDFVVAAFNAGHKIGSNGLKGEKYLEKLEPKDLVTNLVSSGRIIQDIIGKRPATLLASSTLYTDEFLQGAYVSGYKEVVSPTKYINYQSFKDYQQVLNYVHNLERGSIIAIKMAGVLDEREYEKLEATEAGDNLGEPGKADELGAAGAGAADELGAAGAAKEPSAVEEPGAADEPGTAEEPGAAGSILPINLETPEERLVKIINWLLQALEEAEYQVVWPEDLYKHQSLIPPTTLPVDKRPGSSNQNQGYQINLGKISRSRLEDLRLANGGVKAKEYHTIHTTEKALSYSFYGIEHREILNKVLDNLDLLGAKSSFFINKRDLTHHPAVIKEIAARGHELGISLIEAQDKDYYTALESILLIQKTVEELTGQKPGLVRFPYYIQLNDEVLEAVASAGCQVVWQDLVVASSQVGVDGNLEGVMANIFGEGNIVARRGYIIFCRLDYYRDPDLIPEALLRIARERIDLVAYNDEIENNGSEYKLKTIGSILAGEKTYEYPVEPEAYLPELKDLIGYGKIAGLSEKAKGDLIKNNYIGNPDINKLNTLPGFVEEEIGEIDTTGVFTNEKVLFLTFDDWASDKSINQLLYVLEKHGVVGNFFIRTNYMLNNPNILRAIAEAGHDIGSHSDEHLPFAINATNYEEDDTSSLYLSLSPTEVIARKEDLLLSFNKLLRVVGDVAVDGKPALTGIFRPPTLAMSKIGMEAIFDMGFSYIVSGDFSTHDYEDVIAQPLVDKLIYGMDLSDGSVRKLQNGSVLVMHMSDFKVNPKFQPNVTAEALDLAIPLLKEQGYSFGRLSDYLGGIGGENLAEK